MKSILKLIISLILELYLTIKGVIVKFSVWLRQHFVYPVLFCLLHVQKFHQ